MAATAGPDTGSRRRALLVATGGYTDPGLAALRAPTGDVDALAAVLADGSIGGFDVTRLVDRPTEELKMQIEGFFAEARRHDLLLLYFSCHGVLSQSRRFYFATATTALNLLRATAIEDGFVNDVMQHCRARSVVLILDCCHSGAFGKGLAPKSALTVDVEQRFEGRGRVTLSASTALEYAFEDADLAGELEPAAPGSLFTRCLVEGLATGDADTDGDGTISVDELYDYVCQRLRDDVTHQTPGMAGDVRGEIVIARSQRRSAGLPEELEQAAESRLAGVREGAVAELAALLESSDPRLAQAARAALERLARDDSQRVSARARESLGVPAPPPPREPPTIVPPAARRFRAPRRVVVLGAGACLAAIAAAVIVLSPGSGYSGPAVAYGFAGDGAQQIVMAAPSSDNLLIHSGPGSDELTTLAAGGTAEGLASADFDGDGNADLAVGFPAEDAVTVFYGTAKGISAERRLRLAADDFKLPAEAADYGQTLLARDLDDDSYADLVVGAPGDPTAWDTGAMQIVFGSEQGLRTEGARVLEQPSNEEVSAFGSVLRSGDVNGDQRIDLVEGSPDPDTGETSGHMAFCPGGADGPTTCTALGEVDQDGGSSALAVADVDGDGQDDVVQSDAELPGGSGGLRLWIGGRGFMSRVPIVKSPEKLALPEAGARDDEFGGAMDAGPLDDDDFADIVVGVPGHGGNTGAVAVIRGGPDGFALTGHQLLTSDEPGDGGRLGSAIAVLRLDGPDEPPDAVVAADGAPFEDAVLVLRGDSFSTLPGLGGTDGSADLLRLGRTAGGF